MHEIGMCEGLLDLIEQRAAGRPVHSVRVRVGVRHAVLDDAFDQAFALVATGTGAQGAAVDLVVTPVTVSCRSCDHRFDSLDALAICANCGAAEVDLHGGDELVLESIQFGPPGQPTTGPKEPADVSRHPR